MFLFSENGSSANQFSDGQIEFNWWKRHLETRSNFEWNSLVWITTWSWNKEKENKLTSWMKLWLIQIWIAIFEEFDLLELVKSLVSSKLLLLTGWHLIWKCYFCYCYYSGTNDDDKRENKTTIKKKKMPLLNCCRWEQMQHVCEKKRVEQVACDWEDSFGFFSFLACVFIILFFFCFSSGWIGPSSEFFWTYWWWERQRWIWLLALPFSTGPLQHSSVPRDD